MQRKIKIFEESKIDERFNLDIDFINFKHIQNCIRPRRARTISLHAMNDTNLALRFISYDRSKLFIKLKYPKSERFNINYNVHNIYTVPDLGQIIGGPVLVKL